MFYDATFFAKVFFVFFGAFAIVSPHLLFQDGDIKPNPGPTRILQLNCRSLRVRGRASEISRFACSNKTDIVLLCETWLREQDPTPKTPWFVCALRVDRCDGTQRGGGVITYVQPSLPVSSCNYERLEKAEIAIQSIRIENHRSITISNFYVSPKPVTILISIN